MSAAATPNPWEPVAYGALAAIVFFGVLILVAWPLLKRAGSDVYMTWEELRLRTSPSSIEVADQPPYDWAKELRALGRPVEPANRERRHAA